MTETALWRIVQRATLLVFSILFVVFLVRELRSVLVQLALAILLAAAANPLIEAVTTSDRARGWRWRPSRGIAALGVFLCAALILALGAFIVLSSVGPDLAALAVHAPEYVARAELALEDLASAHPDVAAGVQSALPSLQDALAGGASVLGQASRVVGVATGAVTGLLYLVFTLIVALYLAIDGDRIRRYLVQFLPFDRHEQALQVTERIGNRLGAWARGEALLGLIIGSMTWVTVLLLGLPYAGVLAVIAGVGELVPNLGPIIAAIPLITVGFLSSPQQGILALAAAVVIQQLENNLIVPRVMARAVELHPVAVMLAILSGGELLGIPGALLAVPFVASLSTIVDEIQRERIQRHQKQER